MKPGYGARSRWEEAYEEPGDYLDVCKARAAADRAGYLLYVTESARALAGTIQLVDTAALHFECWVFTLWLYLCIFKCFCNCIHVRVVSLRVL